MSTTSPSSLPASLRSVPSPVKIKEYLDRYVIGQEEAKKTLSVAVHNHYRRLQLTYGQNQDKVTFGKSNVLLMGPTGCGKTHLVNTIAQMLNVPCYIQDCTKITASGYVGSDVEDCLAGLLRKCNYDISKAEMGIIMLDEIDKNRKAEAGVSVTRDVSGECVQQSLLKIVEGDIVGVPPMGGRKHPEQSLLYIDTSNILFIASGAFVGLEDVIRNRLGQSKRTIGFSGVMNKEQGPGNTVLSQLLPEDLNRFGMIPEFVGRFPVQTYVEPLDKDALVRILTDPTDSVISQYQQIMALDSIDLRFTSEALEAIAGYAQQLGTGARGLRSILEKVMRDVMFDVPSRASSQRSSTLFEVTEDIVRNKMNIYLNVV